MNGTYKVTGICCNEIPSKKFVKKLGRFFCPECGKEILREKVTRK